VDDDDIDSIKVCKKYSRSVYVSQ